MRVANFPAMHSHASLSELVPNIQVHKLRDSTEILICQIIGSLAHSSRRDSMNACALYFVVLCCVTTCGLQ